MKIGIFTDTHYSTLETPGSSRKKKQSLDRIKKIIPHFEEENCDRIIFLGDLIDTESSKDKLIENIKTVKEVLDRSKIPTTVLMGNHDAFLLSPNDFYSILGEQYRPQNHYEKNKNLIFIDTCYKSNGTHYQPGGSGWEDACYPYPEDLKNAIDKADGDTYLFLHHNLQPDMPKGYHLSNEEELRKILEDSGKVKTVYSGHYHEGCEATVNGIYYKTFKAVCSYENASWIIEI